MSDTTLAPGTYVSLLAGTYTGDYVQAAGQSGTEANPIVYMPWNGERAIIDGSITTNGDSVYWIEIEVTNTGAYVTSGIQIGGGDDVRIINCIIHDLANGSNGIGGWSVGSGHIFYGCNIWGCSPDEEDPHGHGIYAQNEEEYGAKTIRHCIIHDNGKRSMQLSATPQRRPLWLS